MWMLKKKWIALIVRMAVIGKITQEWKETNLIKAERCAKMTSTSAINSASGKQHSANSV